MGSIPVRVLRGKGGYRFESWGGQRSLPEEEGDSVTAITLLARASKGAGKKQRCLKKYGSRELGSLRPHKKALPGLGWHARNQGESRTLRCRLALYNRRHSGLGNVKTRKRRAYTLGVGRKKTALALKGGVPLQKALEPFVTKN